MSELVEVVIHEWEEKKLPEDLAKDTEFLNKLIGLFDRRGRRVFDVVLKLDGKVAIKARGYVGIFAIRDSNGRDVILIVEPKIGVRNIVWMLAISEAKNFKEVREIENIISLPADSRSIIDLLVIGVVRKFLEKLSEALAYGFLELPALDIEEGIVVRGRILSSLLPKSLLSSSSPKVTYELQYYTTNNPINQYILDAGYMLYLGASHLLKMIDENASTVLKAMLELDYTPSLITRNFYVHEFFSVTPLDRPYINELLRLATVIRKWLEHEQPPYPREFVGVPALYINMNNLFESFVRKMMLIAARWLSRTRGIRITVRKAGRNEQALVTTPKPKAYLEPDIVIEANGKPIAVGDVKYKLVKDPFKSGSEGDRDAVNQVYTYMHGWNVEKGFLVYPSIKNASFCESYTLKDGKGFYVIRVHIDKAAKSFKELRNSRMFNVLLEFLKELME